MKKRLLALLLSMVLIFGMLPTVALADGGGLTVTYNDNGAKSGTVPVDSNTYNTGDTVTVLGNTDLALGGYAFDGWNTQADGKGTTYAADDTFSMDDLNVTLYAVWTEVYKVTYNDNGATSGTVPVDSRSYKTGDTVKVLANTGDLALDGYTFDGWNTQADGKGTTYAADATFSMSDSGVTLYAVWTEVYKVTYNDNGATSGTVPVDSRSYKTGDSVKVLANTGDLALDGYTFDGWNTQADGRGTTYAADATFSMGDSDVTLYAVWTEVYKVTYNDNGATSGIVPVDSRSYKTGDSVKALANTGDLALDGYTFDGWNTQSDGKGTSYAADATFSMGNTNVALYAVWTAINYTVTYIGNGAASGAVPLDSNTYNIGNTVTVLGNTGGLALSGYTFNGWNTQADGKGISYTAASKFSISDSNVKLYAVWAVNSAETPAIDSQPAGGWVNVNDTSFTLNVTAHLTGTTGTLSYQWYSNTTDSNMGGTLISGATSNNYNVPTGSKGKTYYYCVITNYDSTAVVQYTYVISSTAKVIVTDCSLNDVNQILAFLNQKSAFGSKYNYEVLGYDRENPATWKEIKWISVGDIKYADIITWDNEGLAGNLDLTKCILLTSLDCSNNEISKIDVNGLNSLYYLNCSGNGAYDYNGGVSGKMTLNATQTASLNKLMCSYCGLTSLDVEGMTSLRTLDCSYNQLTGIVDLSHISNLRTLTCSDNGMKSLKLSNQASLNYLDCSDNLLTSLTLTWTESGVTSSCSALQYLYCTDNKLASITGLPDMTSLEGLYIDSNSFSGTLDVTSMTKLTTLSCSQNTITGLKLGGLNDITSLDCSGNSITYLDLSGNTKLNYLSCSGNAIGSINGLGSLTALQRLYIDNNSFSGILDVSALTALIDINCSGNKISGFGTNGLAGLTKLTGLDCSDNAITGLDLTNHSSLDSLDCFSNSLVSLVLTGCSGLTSLDCSGNSLKNLDASGSPDIRFLFAEGNPLSGIQAQLGGWSYDLMTGGTGKGHIEFEAMINQDDGDDEDSSDIEAYAVPDDSNSFVCWTDDNGAVFSTDAMINLDTDSDCTLTANFSVQTPSAYLSSLNVMAISDGGVKLSPAFSKNTYKYKVNLGEKDDYLILLPVAESSSAQITVNGNVMGTLYGLVPVSYAVIMVNNGETVNVNIKVSYSQTLTKTYVLTVSRPKSADCDLASIMCNGTKLPGFDAELTNYTVNLDENTTSVTLAAQTNSPLAKVTPASGTYTLKKTGDIKKVTFMVKAQSGKKKPYTVTIIRAASANANLASIKLSTSKAVLSPLFDASKLKYTVTMPASLSSVTIKVAAAGYGATVKIGTKKATSVTVKLAKGGSTVIYVYVTAQSGGTPVMYEIDVSRNSV